MRYGLYGDTPDEESEIWDYGFDGVVATISSAKDRYTKRIDIPREELERLLTEGRTQQEIASYYGCSVDTVQRRIKSYGIDYRKTATFQRCFAGIRDSLALHHLIGAAVRIKIRILITGRQINLLCHSRFLLIILLPP